MVRKKILIVDDEESVRGMLSSCLEANGYDVDTAGDGIEGLARINAARPDLVILDVVMPRMDGFTFFKEIRKKAERKGPIPVLMLTGREKTRDTFETFEIEAFLAKPIIVHDLLNAVDGILRDRVIVVSREGAARDLIASILGKTACRLDLIPGEGDLAKKSKGKKYRLVIAHLASIGSEPREFIAAAKKRENGSPAVIIYSDESVPGLERSSAQELDEVGREWIDAGADRFYDPRITLDGLIYPYIA
ncbi:MAG: response regulator [Candidatus Omnitrophota bacterium]